MRIRAKSALLVSLLLATTFAQAADESADLRDRLKAASELSKLDADSLQPWHWQLDLTLFDTDGKNPSQGRLELWFNGGNMLMQYSIRSEQMTVLRVGDKLYRTPGELKQLPNALFLQLQLLHPIPDEAFAPTTTERLTKEKVGNLNIDAIAPTLIKPATQTIAVSPPFSFMLQATTSRLLSTYVPRGLQILRQTLGMFQAHEVATDLGVYIGRALIEEAKTAKLEAMPANAGFQVAPEMIELTEPIEVSAGEASRMLIGSNPPSYPSSAKERRVQGKLVFDAIIGRDGHVESLQPVGSPDPDLLKEAAGTIRSWIYRPFVLDGIPVKVKTKINMNFSIG